MKFLFNVCSKKKLFEKIEAKLAQRSESEPELVAVLKRDREASAVFSTTEDLADVTIQGSNENDNKPEEAVPPPPSGATSEGKSKVSFFSLKICCYFKC